MNNIIIFRSKLHSKQIANSLIDSQLEAARIKAAWDFKDGDPSNPYIKNSYAWTAYEEEFFKIYMTGLYAEQGN